MLGRVRPYSIDCLELERPPPKIIKNDVLSIYETTLEKLRLGSRCALNSSSAGATKIEDGLSTCSSATASPSCTGIQSIKSSKQQKEED